MTAHTHTHTLTEAHVTPCLYSKAGGEFASYVVIMRDSSHLPRLLVTGGAVNGLLLLLFKGPHKLFSN